MRILKAESLSTEYRKVLSLASYTIIHTVNLIIPDVLSRCFSETAKRLKFVFDNKGRHTAAGKCVHLAN